MGSKDSEDKSDEVLVPVTAILRPDHPVFVGIQKKDTSFHMGKLSNVTGISMLTYV
jgi:hypothetical protein